MPNTISADKPRRTKICPICGVEFEYQRSTARICPAKKCKDRADYLKRAKPDETKVDPLTGEVFQARPHQRFKTPENCHEYHTKVRAGRLMALSRAFEEVIYKLAATDMSAAFGYYQCIFDVIDRRYEANPASIAELQLVVKAAKIDIGGSHIVSLVRSMAFGPAHLFPERTVRDCQGNVIRNHSARRSAVIARAEKLNRTRFVADDWSKPTLAELHNAFCKGMFGINCYSVDRASKQGDPVGRMNANSDVEPAAIFASILGRAWATIRYHQAVAGKLRLRSGNEFGPGARLMKAAGFTPVVDKAPDQWKAPEGRIVRGRWRSDFAIEREILLSGMDDLSQAA